MTTAWDQQRADADERAMEVEILEDEITRLRQRVADLEFTVTEYRKQMSEVLGSASWKATSPIRATASRYRTAKVKARRAARHVKHRIENRSSSESATKVLTAGLFPPPLDALPLHSPLRAHVDINTIQRPRSADGPLRRPEGDPTIAVVAHVHYPELWGDIEDRLVRMPVPYDLLVTITEGQAESAIGHIRRRHPKAHIEIVPNRGRDWAPTVRLLNKGLLSGYDAIAKVHTKKSEHRIDGDGWRLALLDGIFESPDQIQRIIDLLDEDRTVGLVVPTGHVEGIEHWGSNQGIVEMLASRLPMAFDPDELQFPGGSMFWCRPWLLERLSDLALDEHHFEPEAGQYDGTTAHAIERIVGVFTKVAGMDIVEAMDVRQRLANTKKNSASTSKPNIYAFYLPQYHRTPENDEFWGEGFTDWANVRRAKPIFHGQRQPLLPNHELGEYDLSDPNVLRRQAKLAKDHGIDGFIFHHYWFDGRKVLDTPINNWLENKDIDLPLAINWANESWTRTWDGLKDDILIEQTYGDDWANRFWDDIAPFLMDERYTRVDGKPMLVVYRIGQIPNPIAVIDTWRERAKHDGHPGLHLLAVMPLRDFEPIDPKTIEALDGLVAFPPGSQVNLASIVNRAKPTQQLLSGDVLSYDAALPATEQLRGTGAPTHPAVMPGWDNTARRGAAAYAFHGANPVTWRRHVQRAGGNTRHGHLFINAWNEWAEGAAIEGSSGVVRGIKDAWR